MIPFLELLAADAPVAQAAAPCTPQDGDDDWELDARGCRKEKKKYWEPGSIVGARLAISSTHGAEKDGTYVAAMAMFASEQFKVGKIFSGHESSYGYLGGGSAGFEGGLGGTFLVGARAPLGEKHGPLARVGLSMEMQGNKRFYYSRIALPTAEIGYQYASDRTILEAGGRGGAVITGRYNTGDRTHRELGGGSFEWGFYAAAHTRHSRADISYTRIQADDNYPGGAVGTLRANGCGYIGFIGICGDAMLVNGDGYVGLPRQSFSVSTFYGGITVGFIDL